MALIRLLPLLGLLAACAATPKTYQQACFEPVAPEATGLAALGAPKQTPKFDPVLTVQEQGGRTLVYCQ